MTELSAFVLMQKVQTPMSLETKHIHHQLFDNYFLVLELKWSNFPIYTIKCKRGILATQIQVTLLELEADIHLLIHAQQSSQSNPKFENSKLSQVRAYLIPLFLKKLSFPSLLI